MITHINESESTRRRALAEQILRFRDEPIETMREVAMSSAGGIKSLKAPIRAFAHSGVKLATVSQNAVQNLIELESEVITSVLTAAAMRLERAARAENVFDLVLDQAEMFGATRDRIVDHTTRAVEIFKVSGRDLRDVAKAHLRGRHQGDGGQGSRGEEGQAQGQARRPQDDRPRPQGCRVNEARRTNQLLLVSP